MHIEQRDPSRARLNFLISGTTWDRKSQIVEFGPEFLPHEATAASVLQWLYISFARIFGRPHSRLIGPETSTSISVSSGSLIAGTAMIICSFSFENFTDYLCLEGADIEILRQGFTPNFGWQEITSTAPVTCETCFPLINISKALALPARNALSVQRCSSKFPEIQGRLTIYGTLSTAAVDLRATSNFYSNKYLQVKTCILGEQLPTLAFPAQKSHRHGLPNGKNPAEWSPDLALRKVDSSGPSVGAVALPRTYFL